MISIKFDKTISTTTAINLDDLKNNMLYDSELGALRTRTIDHYGAVHAKVNFNVTEAGYATVWAGCSCEENYDKFLVSITSSPNKPGRTEGHVLMDISGERSISYNSVSLAPGSYWLHFLYTKDGSNSRGKDCGIVQRIDLPVNYGANIKVAGTWSPLKKQRINIQGAWLPSLESYVKIRDTWTKYMQSVTFENAKLTFTELEVTGSFGWVRDDGFCVRAASGTMGTGRTVGRTLNPIRMEAGQTLAMGITHFAIDRQKPITGAYAQDGLVHISPIASYNKNDPDAQRIYYDPNSPGLGEVFFERSITVNRTGDYYIFLAVDGPDKGYDTHIAITNIRLNNEKLY